MEVKTHSKHLPKLLRHDIRDHPRRIRFAAFVPYWDGEGLGGKCAGCGPLSFIAEGFVHRRVGEEGGGVTSVSI